MDRDHLRLAMTTNSLIDVDANFIATRQMVFYDVGVDWSEFVDVMHFSRSGRKGPGGGQGVGQAGCCMNEIEEIEDGHDPLADRVAAVEGCSVLFTCGLSDLAAMQVQARSVFPVKTETIRPIDDVIAQVQRMMRGGGPLWMRRVMLDGSGQRIPFAREAQCE